MDSNQFDFQMPKLSKKAIKTIKWIVSFVIFIILLNVALNWLVQYVWNDVLGYGQVFATIFMTRLGIGAVGFVLFFLSSFILFSNIRKTYLREFREEWMIPVISEGKKFFWVNTGISLFAGWLGYTIIRALGWQRLLGYVHQQSFGVADPYFGQDLSFFIFTLPMWNFILNIFLFLVIISIGIKAAFYSLRGLIQHSRRAQTHLLISVVMLGLLLALQFLLNPFERALTNQVNWLQNSVVHGISFTDRFVNIPFDYVMAGVSVVAAILVVFAVIQKRMGWVKSAFILYFGIYILGGAVSIGVQNFIVSPNEFVREEPFLANNVEMTRQAYQITEIKEENREINDTLTAEMIARNESTFQNIRVNDARPLREVYNQLQSIRPYYDFLDVDIDRYMIDGEYRQVFISARELTQTNLPEQAQTWVNQNLRYTHGYGVAISAVNEITPEGQPKYIVQDIPPKGPIDIARPQIYFGENRYDSVLVNTAVTEFDYPDKVDDEDYWYEGEQGIPLQGWKRFLFAWDEKSFRYAVSGQITKETQLLQTRNIYDRIRRIAPFIELETDAYPVIRQDGSMVWIIDAFTMTDRYPFSDTGGYKFNYIRNSIKVMVDAYTGEVTFYFIDQSDPIAKTYQNMFPSLFTTEVPEDIKAHFRYPETLFTVQADIYRSYHMTNLEQFYNREDYWQFPTEKYYNTDIRMDPYYVTLKMDDNDREEFVLMFPFTPNKRQNLIAWMGVRNDGDKYGEMFVYKFTRQRNIYGPQQIENRINQNATISQQLNLWSQGGSKVIRGNMLVIPIEDTLIYVEPIYLESTNATSLPEVKQIIVAYQDYIVMEPTLDLALAELLRLLGQDVPPEMADDPAGDESDGTPGLDTEIEAIEQIRDAFEAYRKANQAGDYVEAGRQLQRIEQILQRQTPPTEQLPEDAIEENVDEVTNETAEEVIEEAFAETAIKG